MRSSISFLYRQLFAIKRRQQSAGFTLLELLISLVVASLVMGGLLYSVVQLTTMDKREANLDQVQRDMNRAMSYITNDLQEAVYVYPNPQTVATQLNADPSFPNGVGNVPVLAFWRIDPIDNGFPNCATGTPAFIQECQLLRIRQATYSLVVYVQRVNDGNQNWPGQSRIIRYELSKYSNRATLTLRPGYRDPTTPTDADAPFEVWRTGNGAPRGSASVLVDYIQAPQSFPLNRAPLSNSCQGYGSDTNGNPLYSIVPSDATISTNNSFFACVRNTIVGGGQTNRGSQDLYLFLRGNVQSVVGGAGSYSNNYNNASVRGYSDETSLPILETQVLVKGVINKGFVE